MITLTRLDGTKIFLNEKNIQWIEIMPDTAITLLNGARLLVKEKLEEVVNIIDERIMKENLLINSKKNIENFENEE